MIETIHNNCDNCAHGLEHADPACFNCATNTMQGNKVFRHWTLAIADIPDPAPVRVLDFPDTLRDELAISALPWCMENFGIDDTSTGRNWKQVAADEAYSMADAMLEARNK